MGHRAFLLVTFGFLSIGVALLGIAVFIAVQTVQEVRIGRGLIETGEPAQALVVTAERVERAQCDLSQWFICSPPVNIIATVVYQVSGLRSGAEVRLTPEEYEAYLAGQEVFIDVFYLPSFPAHVERTQGDRLAAATRGTLPLYILAALGLIFLTISGVAALVARKRTRALSTGQGR